MRQIVAGLRSDIEDIEAELNTADNKGTFSYPRSKGVRKAALEIKKKASDLRDIAQATFKETEAN